MLAESETDMDYFNAQELLAKGQFADAADTFYRCWSRFQSTDFVENADSQAETADDALSDCISIVSGRLTPEERWSFLERHGFSNMDELVYADKGS